jgi:hypothetical protein
MVRIWERTFSGDCKSPLGVGGPLTITAGAVEYGTFQGTMSANGYAMLRSDRARNINLKIQPGGGTVGVYGAPIARWQKQ